LTSKLLAQFEKWRCPTKARSMIYPLFRAIIVVLGLAGTSWATDTPAPRPIADFEQCDHRGVTRKLSDWKEKKAVVVIFLGVECPLNQRYAPRLVELADQ